MTCRECQQRRGRRRRFGLCRQCWGISAVRAAYRAGNWYGNLPLDPEPTRCVAGTVGKLLVFARRVQGGYRLFHPLDGPDLA